MMQGLSSADVQELLQKFGHNLIQERKRTPVYVQFLRQFKDLMVIILIFAAVFAFFAHEKIDAVIIFGIVILNATIGFLQEFKAEKAIEALKKLLSPKARVIRDAKQQIIETKDLVPGDILILSEGDKVGADCELLKENEIALDESILTGESVSVSKDTGENKNIFMGTQVVFGNGIARVTKTGMNSQFGCIAALTTETKKDSSPLQKELMHIGLFVGKITILISGILFFIGIFAQKRQFVETLLFAVSVAVAAVPEGLPATITVALALGVQRLAKKNAIVKQLSSAETLGQATVICSDKTGTLTKNEMTVQEIILGDFDIVVQGAGYDPQGKFSVRSENPKKDEFIHEKEEISDLAYKRPIFYGHLELAMRASLICNNARLNQADERWQVLGDPTEGALITVAEKAGIQASHVAEKHERIYEAPFDSSRKRMSAVAKEIETGDFYVYTKGAPDSLLGVCTHILKNSKAEILSQKEREALLERTEALASRALRTIAVAYKKISTGSKEDLSKDELEKDLIFLGLIAMADPPREEVKQAVKLAHKAGIRTFIITGDHGFTAHAIARELGMVKSGKVNIVTGEMLDSMSEEKLISLMKPGQQTIFARISPQHKLRIVDELKKSGEIVAVTGDGVNDAPALKRADIGVAMGISGTDVSKEAANMVLADDSFGTIVSAIVEGRTIYENMKKFIYYIFSSNIGELIAIFSTLLLGLPAPLTAVFILIINTLTDVFPALALGVEPVEQSVLDSPPRKPDSKIMEWHFIRRYLLAGLWIGAVTFGTFIWNLADRGWKFGESLDTNSYIYIESATMAFVVLTLLQMVHAWNSRSEKDSVFKMGFFRNMHLIGAILLSTIATVAFVHMPFFQNYLKTAPLSLKKWMILIAFSFSILAFEEIRKLFVRLKQKAVYEKASRVPAA